jgi:hypothetical protein
LTARGRRTLVLVLAAAVLAPPAVAAAATTPPPVDASPLSSNGFESPSCASAALAAQLSPAERTNCSVSGVAVAPVPLSNYAVDINIPSGLDASFNEDILSVVQDLFVTPVWTAVVWLIHVVLIALEWCYSIDLLAPTTLARAGSALGEARQIFTDPWLGLALAVAATGFAWQGLVRRRVLDTLGQAALLAVMVTSGLWIIADPSGTVGAVGGLADRAALATVAATATGNPNQPVASVDAAFASVLATAIDGPWCYLEFGDVAWCRDPAALDPGLRATATRLEALYRAEASCRPPVTGLVQCAPGGSALQSQLSGAATALGEAQTNGELFLALPPEAISRTALSGATALPTLYGTLCGSGDASACTAPTAPQAEFRTASGTWPRVGGLLLIVAGTVGMLLLLGFLALRLLGAALAVLLYLLLAPLAVLAPALGEAGRGAFRLWLTRLLGAALAKLVYSVALGVVLLMVTLLSSLNGLGWWTQWLLISVFWWMAFEQRHRLLSLVLHERSEPLRRSPFATRAWFAGRSAGAGIAALRGGGRVAGTAGGRVVETVKRLRELPQDGGPPAAGRRRAPGQVAIDEVTGTRGRRLRARQELEGQVARLRQVSEAPSVARTDRQTVLRNTGVGYHTEVAALEARGVRLATALRAAHSRGDRRRVASLQLRAQGVAAELAARRPPGTSRGNGRVVRDLRARVARSAPTLARTVETRRVTRELDRAAQAPPEQLRRSGGGAERLAGLAGISPAEYLRRTPAEQRVARLEIERELARRRDLLREVAPTWQSPLRRRVSRAAAAGAPASPALSQVGRRARQFGSRPR